VNIYKYQPATEARGVLGYAWEFIYSWVRTALLSVTVWRRHGFDVIQACNPPDTYWALALPYKLLGRRFIYDQHDLNPEVFISRFGEPAGVLARAQYKLLVWLERRTYRLADHVISTNESYRQVAMVRGDKTPDQVTVVRSGPDTSKMRPVQANPELRMGRRYLCCYLGIMGPQDGVDIALRALAILVNDMGREDVHVAFLGFGDCLAELKELSAELGLGDYVTFTGRADAKMITQYLSTADIGLSPDPLNPLNDVSTMNKTMEYMSFALPVVTFDLRETRVSAGDAAVYVEPGDLEKYALSIAQLLDDADRRVEMAVQARTRAADVLDWEPQRRSYIGVFDDVLRIERPTDDETWPAVDRRSLPSRSQLVDSWGHRLLDLRGGRALARYVKAGRIVQSADDPADDVIPKAWDAAE
jgi:glycosyltransferase involved in cell wall biosynthesis